MKEAEGEGERGTGWAMARDVARRFFIIAFLAPAKNAMTGPVAKQGPLK